MVGQSRIAVPAHPYFHTKQDRDNLQSTTSLDLDQPDVLHQFGILLHLPMRSDRPVLVSREIWRTLHQVWPSDIGGGLCQHHLRFPDTDTPPDVYLASQYVIKAKDRRVSGLCYWLAVRYPRPYPGKTFAADWSIQGIGIEYMSPGIFDKASTPRRRVVFSCAGRNVGVSSSTHLIHSFSFSRG